MMICTYCGGKNPEDNYTRYDGKVFWFHNKCRDNVRLFR